MQTRRKHCSPRGHKDGTYDPPAPLFLPCATAPSSSFASLDFSMKHDAQRSSAKSNSVGLGVQVMIHPYTCPPILACMYMPPPKMRKHVTMHGKIRENPGLGVNHSRPGKIILGLSSIDFLGLYFSPSRTPCPPALAVTQGSLSETKGSREEGAGDVQDRS